MSLRLIAALAAVGLVAAPAVAATTTKAPVAKTKHVKHHTARATKVAKPKAS